MKIYQTVPANPAAVLCQLTGKSVQILIMELIMALFNGEDQKETVFRYAKTIYCLGTLNKNTMEGEELKDYLTSIALIEKSAKRSTALIGIFEFAYEDAVFLSEIVGILMIEIRNNNLKNVSAILMFIYILGTQTIEDPNYISSTKRKVEERNGTANNGSERADSQAGRGAEKPL